jgi:heme/copper-type cytochrome/quinol oxidase subunit 1
MFATGLPLLGMSFFSAASMMIAIPSGVQVFCWIATDLERTRPPDDPVPVRGRRRDHVRLGGVTGVMLASVPFDLQVHDTFFVVAHFHYVLFGACVFPLIAGFYHWFPKITGRMLSERLGRWNFWLDVRRLPSDLLPAAPARLHGDAEAGIHVPRGVGWGELNLLSTVGAFVAAVGYCWSSSSTRLERLLRRGAPATTRGATSCRTRSSGRPSVAAGRTTTSSTSARVAAAGRRATRPHAAPDQHGRAPDEQLHGVRGHPGGRAGAGRNA